MPSNALLANKPASPLDAFTTWSRERGVRIDGVTAAESPGRGRGIVAQRRIEAGEEIVHVPASALLTEESVPADFKIKYGDITTHGLLAAFLATGHSQLDQYKTWAATWPTISDFEECMPILWPEKLRRQMPMEGSTASPSLLPPAIGCGVWAHHSLASYHKEMSCGLLHEQEARFGKDFVVVQKAYPSIEVGLYKYCWLVVNTRTFYYELPGLKGQRPKGDCMVMCPFADLFNHADQGCDVAFDDDEYTVTADRVYNPGEEIYVSYGSHSNDFLLLEYGFILESNKWDCVPIDDLLIPNILSHGLRRNKLERAGYLGNYTLGREGVCHRTQVAIRATTLKHKEFKNFVTGQTGWDEGRQQSVANSFIKTSILQPYLTESERALQALKDIDDDGSVQSQVQTLTKRWKQIKNMLEEALRDVRE